jgi:hypothetical protein
MNNFELNNDTTSKRQKYLYGKNSKFEDLQPEKNLMDVSFSNSKNNLTGKRYMTFGSIDVNDEDIMDAVYEWFNINVKEKRIFIGDHHLKQIICRIDKIYDPKNGQLYNSKESDPYDSNSDSLPDRAVRYIKINSPTNIIFPFRIPQDYEGQKRLINILVDLIKKFFIYENTQTYSQTNSIRSSTNNIYGNIPVPLNKETN